MEVPLWSFSAENMLFAINFIRELVKKLQLSKLDARNMPVFFLIKLILRPQS
jgi:hypothetical protein